MADLRAVAERHMRERGISLRALAKAVPCHPSHLSRALRGLKPCSPALARAIAGALGAGGEIIAAATDVAPRSRGQAPASEALDVMAWLTGTNASDDAIEELAKAADCLTEAHTRLPAAKILPEVLGVHRTVHGILRGGRQRLSQARELLRIDSALLAHACLLLGDLGQHEAARSYGSAALLCAQESGADEGIGWTALAKTARWQGSFSEAAGLARRGFKVSGNAEVRAELAYREANAFALFGDAPRARAALGEARRAAEGLGGGGATAWSFSRGREAIFTLSICLHTGDPDGALRAAGTADDYWDGGGEKVTATWAQVRAGAAIACLQKDSLDGAASQLAPVLELRPDLRIHTVTGYLEAAGAMLADRRFAGSPAAAGLVQQIDGFCSSAAGAAVSA
jgi:lambda repressor-like predicted transcriptional regulator